MKLYVAIQRFLNKNWVHYIVLFFILISIVAVIASSFEEMSRYRLALFGITYISSFVFLLEYAARILSAPALHPTKSAIKARLHYTFSFYGFVDFVAILPCVGKALYSVREELVTAYTASFITICFSAILMYYIERNAQPDVFENIGDGIWWAIITFATVGYGDIYPITPLGKLLGCIICLVGVAMVAIPTGIISSSFMSMIQNKERQQMQAEKEQKEKRQEEKHSND